MNYFILESVEPNLFAMSALSTSQRDICIYTGVFGILLSATCFIQHLIIVGETSWLTVLLMVGYIFSGIVFSLLIVQHFIAPVLLIINAVVLLAASMVLLFSGLFSLIVILVYIYTTIIMIFIYLEEYPSKFWQNTLMVREERNGWRDKI